MLLGIYLLFVGGPGRAFGCLRVAGLLRGEDGLESGFRINLIFTISSSTSGNFLDLLTLKSTFKVQRKVSGLVV